MQKSWQVSTTVLETSLCFSDRCEPDDKFETVLSVGLGRWWDYPRRTYTNVIDLTYLKLDFCGTYYILCCIFNFYNVLPAL